MREFRKITTDQDTATASRATNAGHNAGAADLSGFKYGRVFELKGRAFARHLFRDYFESQATLRREEAERRTITAVGGSAGSGATAEEGSTQRRSRDENKKRNFETTEEDEIDFDVEAYIEELMRDEGSGQS
jgi:hypothetical protein